MSARLLSITVLAVSVGALAIASVVEFTPLVIWNASASAPIGLYRIERRALRLGEFALVKPKQALENFIVERGYLPEEVPLLKRVAALSGAQICRDAEAVFVDGIHVADALRSDSAGRVMPNWRGCFTLADDEIFLLNTPSNSLDGRYFGATNIDQAIGVAIPVWISDSND